ncbi:MAG: GatB/YqeY domain-containing protein [Bacteroidales bacterium]|nr:GatB/YqeY domain-containing protein [Bacteroidales bacterium]MDD4684719.1 GatB/YqeY domain-containing protein [Bacteroidales bacterium]
MSLEERINADIKKAMLAKDREKLDSLRAIKAAILLIKTSKSGTEVSEQEEIQTLQRLVKQRKEAALTYKEQNRQELYDVEMSQAAIIEQYLPQQLSEEEIRQTLQTIIKDLGVTSPKDMGRVMGAAQKQFAGKADNKVVSQLIKELLG